jgi:hypothetical protein
MGIGLNAVHLLSGTLPLLGDLSGKKLLTLGVQDCHFTYDKIIPFLRQHKVPHTSIGADEILPTTGFKWALPAEAERYRNCIHQKTLFRMLGFSPQNIYSMDVSEFEGADIVHDLNVPIDDSLSGSFDLIFDGGTIEHVFSLKDAFFNMCRMCRVGGIVVNFSPVDYINHGFINLNAEVFRDCFLANGFEEITLKYIATPTHPRLVDQHYLEYDPDKMHCTLRPYYRTGVYSAYRKIEERALTIPIQGYYRRMYATGAPLAQQRRSRLRRILSQLVRDWLDLFWVSSVLIHGLVSIRRGRKILL